jgi:thymidylate synthase (FAD)
MDRAEMMKVTLISRTESVQGMRPEELLVYVARVSNPSNQANMETAPKLLKYCLDHGHWSVFEHASITVEISNVPIVIATQILRHRSFTFQMFSQRYSESTDVVLSTARRQASKNRQGSIDDLDDDTKREFEAMQKKNWSESKRRYNMALAKGISKEQARLLLPLGTSTTLYMTGNVRSFIHYITARTHPSTQKEHRDVAFAIREVFEHEFPMISSILWSPHGVEDAEEGAMKRLNSSVF